eukprot:310525_1
MNNKTEDSDKEIKLYPFFKSMSPKYSQPKSNGASSIPPAPTTQQSLISIALSHKQIAINKLENILNDVDEDKNGEIDYQEFQEGISQINNNLMPNEMKLIYNECIWNDIDNEEQ